MLASGSFAKNKEMLEQYHTEWADSYFSCPESLTGDGIQLALKYGGVVDYQQAYLPGFLASYDSHFELAFMHYTTPGIIVNINGDQFGNIMKSNHAVMSAAKADPPTATPSTSSLTTTPPLPPATTPPTALTPTRASSRRARPSTMTPWLRLPPP